MCEWKVEPTAAFLLEVWCARLSLLVSQLPLLLRAPPTPEWAFSAYLSDGWIQFWESSKYRVLLWSTLAPLVPHMRAPVSCLHRIPGLETMGEESSMHVYIHIYVDTCIFIIIYMPWLIPSTCDSHSSGELCLPAWHQLKNQASQHSSVNGRGSQDLSSCGGSLAVVGFRERVFP